MASLSKERQVRTEHALAEPNKLTEAINAPMNDYGFSATYDDEDRLLTWERDEATAAAERRARIKAEGGSKTSQSWSLSAVGNWNSFTENTVTETRTHGDAHELTAIGGTSLTYDAKGNLTTNVNNHTYTWDMDNMLKSATVPSGSTEGIVGTHEYEYDALGRRVAKIVEDSGTDTTTLFIQKTTPIAYSPYSGQVLAEYEFTTGSPALVRKYAYGDYIDEPLVLINVSGASETMYYYHRNQQYSINALTDVIGNVAESYSYNCQGLECIWNSAYAKIDYSTAINHTNYTGRELDVESELLYFRSRMYSKSICRFAGRDALKYINGASMYRKYFQVSRIDPSGHGWWDLDVPATPAKCARAVFYLTAAARTLMFTGSHDRLLWDHYLGGTGKDLTLPMGAFDGFGSDRAKIKNDILKKHKLPDCNKTATYTGKIKPRAEVSSYTPMINQYSLSAKYVYSISKKCLLCDCVSISFNLQIDYYAFDTTDFNPGDVIPLPIGTISDDLINACNIGSPFNISAKKTRTYKWANFCHPVS